MRVAVEHFTDPAREVTGTAIRDINFGRIRDEALARLRHRADLAERWGPPYAGYGLEELRRASTEAAKARPPRGYPAEHYRRIALRYLELVAEGRRDVLKALAEAEGVGRETVRGWLRKATDLKMLGAGKRGYAGREPGPNLYAKEGNNG